MKNAREAQDNKLATKSNSEDCCKWVRKEAFILGDSPWYSISLVFGGTDVGLDTCTSEHMCVIHPLPQGLVCLYIMMA
jgi:hypothetical protein